MYLKTYMYMLIYPLPIIYLRPSFMTTSNCTKIVMFDPSYKPWRRHEYLKFSQVLIEIDF